MATGEGQAPGDSSLQGPEGLLFTGDAIRRLTREQIAEIGQFASRVFGAEMREVRNVEHELGGMALANVEAEQPAPLLVNSDDFQGFAREHGFSRSLATRTWDWFRVTGQIHPLGRNHDLPPYAVFDPTGSHLQAIELGALYDHLYPAINSRGRFAGSKLQDDLLTTMVNEWLQPARPVPSRRER
jgi:hypothetical protein